jgi:hypothetical protein
MVGVGPTALALAADVGRRNVRAMLKERWGKSRLGTHD